MACGFAATHHSAGALRLLRWLIQATNLGMVEHAGPSRNWSGTERPVTRINVCLECGRHAISRTPGPVAADDLVLRALESLPPILPRQLV